MKKIILIAIFISLSSTVFAEEFCFEPGKHKHLTIASNSPKGKHKSKVYHCHSYKKRLRPDGSWGWKYMGINYPNNAGFEETLSIEELINEF